MDIFNGMSIKEAFQFFGFLNFELVPHQRIKIKEYLLQKAVNS